MSFYGATQLPSLTLNVEKKRHGPNQNLRFGGTEFVHAYRANDLTPVEVVQGTGGIVVVSTGNDNVVTVASGPKNENETRTYVIVDTIYDTTLEPNVWCVVIEGAVSVGSTTYSSEKDIPVFSVEQPTTLKMYGVVKLLLVKAG